MFEMIPSRRNNKLRHKNNYADTFVDEFFNSDFFSPALMNNTFNVDVKETENSYLIEADLPGVNRESIDLEYENNYLTISATRNDTVEEKQHNYVRRERRYGEFKRSFYVDDVEENGIDAIFNDGVLKITLPKHEKERSNKRKIDIH
ncbi:heat shock protein Hsp18 [Clostridium sp. ZS2-4]|uniref:heat shock protein Hsp18 n=1 Tax=Clostridium sp. ZS2-4 TaxID=2987703 RepID=UPI00227D1912|nr:heat shock protein Hsp18 [Clostridium sp. ZS2-4]MCY6356354.1 Hsp20/alpha crystallin family protein [Clostridium sp. ZS2-4]